jgi:hypothetical protein
MANRPTVFQLLFVGSTASIGHVDTVLQNGLPVRGNGWSLGTCRPSPHLAPIVWVLDVAMVTILRFAGSGRASAAHWWCAVVVRDQAQHVQ